MFIGLDGDNGP